jgi:p21-activated kinase 1
MSLPSSRTATNLKHYDSSSPSASSTRRASKVTVEYHKPSRQSIQEYQELLTNVNLHSQAAANYKDPFVPSRQAPPPPTTHHASKPSRGQDPSVSHHKSRSSLHKPSHHSRRRSVSTAPTTIHEVESDPFSTVPSSPQQEYSSFTFPPTQDMAASSMPPTPPRPSRANTVNLNEFYTDPNLPPVHGTASTPHLDQFPRESYGDSHTLVTNSSSTVYSPSVNVTSFSPPPVDRMGTAARSRSGTVTAKSKKGMLGFMTDFLNSNKRPEISTPYDPVHLTHVGFNSSTGEFTGLPKEWQQLLQDSGISKSDQEKNPLAVMEIVKFYQEGGGDVWDKMGHAPAPGGSQSPPVPGTAHPAHPGQFKSVDDSVVPTVSPFIYTSSGALADSSKRPSLSPPKKIHSSGGPQSVSSSHAPASYRPAPSPAQPVQPNLDRSTSHRTAPKPPRNDTLVRSNTTRDRRSPAPPAAVKPPARESPNASTADLPSKSQSTTAVNTPAAERRAPQPPTAPQQPSPAVASLAKTAGATPRRREKKKEDKANDADIVKRLQQICTDADPTRLYRNLVKIGQG